jgi:hypothetical protein
MEIQPRNTSQEEEEEVYSEKPEPCYVIEGEWAKEETE